MNEHNLENVSYDNLGNGWRIYCSCGFTSAPCKKMEDAGWEFDDHLQVNHEENDE